MAIKNVVRITTTDTKKTYEFPGEDNPELWEVSLTIRNINHNGHVSPPTTSTPHNYPKGIVHIERKTLENAGVLPMAREREKEEPTETAEDLIIRLLEHLGYYPDPNQGYI